jgi:hypothetical protein
MDFSVMEEGQVEKVAYSYTKKIEAESRIQPPRMAKSFILLFPHNSLMMNLFVWKIKGISAANSLRCLTKLKKYIFSLFYSGFRAFRR